MSAWLRIDGGADGCTVNLVPPTAPWPAGAEGLAVVLVKVANQIC